MTIRDDIYENLNDTTPLNCRTYSSYHSFGYECLIIQPTRYSHHGGSSLIYHALSNLLVPPEVRILTSYITDHYLIFLKINSIPFAAHRILLQTCSWWTKQFRITNKGRLVHSRRNERPYAFLRFLSLLLRNFHFHSHKKKECKKVL